MDYKFKVGDIVKIKDNFKCLRCRGKELVISDITDNLNPIKCFNPECGMANVMGFKENDIVLLNGTSLMSKYDELKGKIEGLNNGWTKEADDILDEVEKNYKGIVIPIRNRGGVIRIIERADDVYEAKRKDIKVLMGFSYNSQCEKNEAFKKALLWLLDHSEIKKDEKQEKIDALKKDVEAIQAKIRELE